jgi:hypothetical protein
MRRIITTTVVSFGALLSVLGIGAAPAFASSPWWHLSSSARPAYLHFQPGLAPGQSEVQKLSVEPNALFVLKVNHEGVEFFESEPYSGVDSGLFPHATAANVQAKLEAVLGAGNVTVTGQGPEGLPPLLVTSVGEDADKAVPPLEVISFPEEGYTGSATGRVVTVGRAPQSDGVIVATVVDLGDASTSGEGRIVDQLPAGLKAVSVEGVQAERGTEHSHLAGCSLKALKAGEAPAAVCPTGGVAPYSLIEVRIGVAVEAGARTGELNEVSVSGGGAPPASISRPVTISSSPTPFGLEDYELTPEEEGGVVDTQAGSHPFQTTFTVLLNNIAEGQSGNGSSSAEVAGLPKDIHSKFPVGLIGNPKPFEQCTEKQFLAQTNECPVGSVMGVAVLSFGEPGFVGTITESEPVFNLEPTVGEPARLGFTVLSNENPVYLDTSVRTGEDYGITVDANNITQKIAFFSSYITIWGVPGDSRHDSARDGCLPTAAGNYPPCQPLDAHNPPPYFELPTSCSGPLQTSVEADSWEEPGVFKSLSAESAAEPALDGCNRLPFEPSLNVTPDGHAASTPTGLAIHQYIGQEKSLNPKGLGASDVKEVTVTFPEGVVINPAGADGLEACSEALVGYLPGESTPPEDLHFTGKLPGSAGSGDRFEPGVNFCPNASKIGTVRIKTPVLPDPLEGAVYLASQNSNPFGSLVATYIVAEDPTAGILVKLPGELSLNQQTGQLTATFTNIPQAPFEEAEFHLFGGERAPLATPAHCGTYTAKVVFTPWSGNAPVTTESPFEITSGPNNTPCPGASLPFDPSGTAGATDIQAGEYTPFTFTMSRQNGEQNLQSGEVKLPEGLSGYLSNVELCPEPQANEGTCGPNSLIGETTVSVGVGSQPYPVRGGKVYLTGPYNGTGGCTPGPSDPGCAPFGLSIVNPAKAGPYDLKRNTANPAGEDACDCVLVRAKIEVNPETAGLTIVSDPPGSPDAIPTSIEGIPLEIQHVNVTTTRSAFQFNPTNCAKMEVVGNLFSAEGGADTIRVPFQVTNCAALKFQPKFSVSTSGKTSRANGASLTAKVSYPSVPQGTDADIARVKVELPKQLPSRLTTLQKACKQAQFRANPAGCPADSIIGHVKAMVPNIPVALEGPAYFVSNGSEAFPNLVLVLQGYNVTIDLVGDTFIAKNGVTSTTFKAVPDNPVSTFELTLPEGPYSALSANTNLCKAKNLSMPTEFVGQNGAEIHETTKIEVTGCPKARHKAKKASKRHNGKRGTKGKGRKKK